jgi:cyclase
VLARRVIPCLDVREGRVVKGVRFEGLRDSGDPVELAARYDEAGADEVALLDITASHEGRGALLTAVRAAADALYVPLTVGGGVRSEADVEALLEAGADKVSVNSSAVTNPALIDQCARRWGAQVLVVAIDARAESGSWGVYVNGGRIRTGRDAVAWAREACDRGAGEILLTSMDGDGTRAGYDLPLIRAVADRVPVAVIASGGVGTLEHLAEGIAVGHASAVLAASIFHDGEYTIGEAKRYLAAKGIAVRSLAAPTSASAP